MFNQVSLNLGMKFAFTDAKNAFCRSFPLSRPRGPLWAEPCEGLGLPPGVLIAIDILVYGLDDAPAAWRFTVSSFLINDLTFGRSLVEPCWFSKFDPDSGECVAQILVEVNCKRFHSSSSAILLSMNCAPSSRHVSSSASGKKMRQNMLVDAFRFSRTGF